MLDIHFFSAPSIIDNSKMLDLGASSKSVYLLLLNFGLSQKSLRNLLSEIIRRSPVTICSWSLFTCCDPLQLYSKVSGFSKVASTLILDKIM